MNKYRIGEDKIIYHDQITNQLFDENKQPLFQTISHVEPKNDPVKKNNAPTEIRIVLGQSCNYNCGYCSQKAIGDHN